MTKDEMIQAVEQFKNGDSSAYEKLYNEHYEPLRFYIAKRIGSVDEADDLAQDTFLTVMEKIDSLKEPASFKTWLYQIANNKTADYFRERKHFADFDSEESLESALEQAEDYSDPLAVPADYLENEETQEEIKAAIDSLSDERRSALIMFYYENMRIRDIAKAMGTNENAVNHRLGEARKQIAKRLKKLGHGTYVFVPLPLVLGAIARADESRGAAAFSVTSSPAAVTGTVVAKIVAVAAAAAAVGTTAYVLSNFSDSRLGKVRPVDHSVSEAVTDSSMVTTTAVTARTTRRTAEAELNAPDSAADLSSQAVPAAAVTTRSTAQNQAAAEQQDQPVYNDNGNGGDNNYDDNNYDNDNGGNNGGGGNTGSTSAQSVNWDTGGTSARSVNWDDADWSQWAYDDYYDDFYRAIKHYHSSADTALEDSLAERLIQPTDNDSLSDSMLSRMFSFEDEGYLPARGMVFYNKKQFDDDDPTNDFYVYVIPPKVYSTTSDFFKEMMLGYITYDHNYDTTNMDLYIDGMLAEEEYDMFENIDVNPSKRSTTRTVGSSTIRSTAVHYINIWKSLERYPDGWFFFRFLFEDASNSERYIDLRSHFVLKEDIPLSNELDLLSYIKAKPSCADDCGEYYCRAWFW